MASKTGGVNQEANIQWDSAALCLDWPDGHRSVFPSIWLRDNCPEDRDSRTGQRLVDIVDLPEHPRIEDVEIKPGSVGIWWSRERRQSWFSLPWLLANCGCEEHHEEETRSFWEAADVENLCWMDYAAVRAAGRAYADWLAAIARDGLAFLRGVPARESEVLEAARLLGYVTETNYGRVFDVREVADPNNLAYTAIGLGVHTDNPYRNPVPGYQVLHCLRPGLEGGESVFVDGFAVADHLKSNDPDAFLTLTRTLVPFAFRDAETDLKTQRPLIQLDDSGGFQAVHYNNRSVGPIRIPAKKAGEFYRAYRVFATLLRDPRFELRLKLEQGELVAFDNHRILHGREAFAGPRHLQGCYVARDGLLSNLAVLERRLS